MKNLAVTIIAIILSLSMVFVIPNDSIFIKNTYTSNRSSEIRYVLVISESEVTKMSRVDYGFDISESSGLSYDDIYEMLDTPYHKDLIPYISTIIDMEAKYNVNSLYLLTTLGLESGWGKYHSGTNNIAGWTDGHGGWRNFESVEQCIETVALNLSTIYKDRVGTNIVDVTNRYCPDSGYTDMVIDIMNERLRKI